MRHILANLKNTTTKPTLSNVNTLIEYRTRGEYHHVRFDGAAVSQMEGALMGVLTVELIRPFALEVDGIDQDQPEK